MANEIVIGEVEKGVPLPTVNFDHGLRKYHFPFMPQLKVGESVYVGVTVLVPVGEEWDDDKTDTNYAQEIKLVRGAMGREAARIRKDGIGGPPIPEFKITTAREQSGVRVWRKV